MLRGSSHLAGRVRLTRAARRADISAPAGVGGGGANRASLYFVHTGRLVMLDSLVPAGTDAQGRALYRAPGLTTYRDRGMPVDAVDAWRTARDALELGGLLVIVDRGASRGTAASMAPHFFTAHIAAPALHGGAGVRLYGLTGALVASGFVTRRRGSDWHARYAGMQRLEPGVRGLVALVLGLEDSAVPAVEL